LGEPLALQAQVPPPLLNTAGLPVDYSQTGDLANVTVRQTVRVAAGGRRLRLRFSNEAGRAAMAIGAVRIGLAGSGGETARSVAVSFDGKTSVVVPAGSPLLSDPIDLPTRALDQLNVSIFLPRSTERLGHQGFQYVAGEVGDQTAATTLPSAKLARVPVLVTGVEVETPQPMKVVVTVGDSITEGTGSTALAFRSWPDRLADRLVAARANWSVVNAGISGNRLLRHGTGPSALARFDRDVLSVPGVMAVIVMEGINDIGRGSVVVNGEPVTTEALIAAQRQLIARAHARGVKVIGATLTPYKGANYYSAAGEVQRQAYNQWIRTSGEFDGVIDFAKPLSDAADSLAFDLRFNDRDRLHPNDAGYEAMANFIDPAVITQDAAKAR
jgi:lysophospholipase L1-like esterase